MKTPEYSGNLRANIIKIPEEAELASGIKLFGRTLKSFLFSTDIAIIRNCNADAVIAVYPFTPQPIITHGIKNISDVPIFPGIGGGTTQGLRVVGLGMNAEQQGAMGVVVNAPTSNKVIKMLRTSLEIAIIVTVVSEKENIQARIDAGATILNVSAGSRTPEVIRAIRKDFPDVPIIRTGGSSGETIKETILAGANAISYTPPSTAELFKTIMEDYRSEE